MSNTFSPNGLIPVRRNDGTAWNGQLTQRLIAANNAHSFFKGDPVINLSTGYIDRVAIGSIPTQGTLGIFWGCELTASTSGTPWANKFVASSSTTDVTAWVIDDPNLVYRVWVGTGSSSASGGPATVADIGGNYNWQVGTGNSTSGISGAYLDYASFNTTNTLPLTIIGIVTNPPGVNGTDNTTAGNIVEVLLNQQAYKVGTTGL